jgi:hypothetical protein
MPLRSAFWQRAAQSLPPSVRKRYAADLELAEQVDLFTASLIDAWRQARSAIAQGLHGFVNPGGRAPK